MVVSFVAKCNKKYITPRNNKTNKLLGDISVRGINNVVN